MDAITTDCLALREQVAIYEEQLAAMERQHEMVRPCYFLVLIRKSIDL